MNTNTSSSPMNFQGISDHLKQSIVTLSESSRQLHQAVIHRDVNQVWKLLADQQEQIEQFEQYNLLWKQLVIDNGLDSPQIRVIKEELNQRMQQMRKANTSNGSLIRSFLAALDRAFRKTAADLGARTSVYGKRGRMNMQQKSLLINRVG